jgi:tellurite methyltransferase
MKKKSRSDPARDTTVNKALTGEYSKFYRTHDRGFGLEASPFVRTWAKKTTIKDHSKALDLGCGNGRNAIYLADLGFDVLAIDISNEAIDALNKLASVHCVSRRINAICSDVLACELPKTEFSLALGYTILDHLSRRLAGIIIDRVHRSLLPAGYFLVTTYSVEDPAIHGKRGKATSPSSSWIKNPYSKEDLFRAFSDFDIIFHREIEFQDRHHDEPHWHVMHQLVTQK